MVPPATLPATKFVEFLVFSFVEKKNLEDLQEHCNQYHSLQLESGPVKPKSIGRKSKNVVNFSIFQKEVIIKTVLTSGYAS